MSNNPYKVNDGPCTKSTGHVWSNAKMEIDKMCLHCYVPKLILK